ncbi:hypothetical protein [Billgrantia gudaonensis]|uniref:Mu-like prophage FluMu N-terminal domain-containing protein n=1 Tax=Billgrantia gudaonensis TaxID=376427 RepID=A0A1G9AX75_9GAMM|nr:hypothetical protein [Halomonas gudaonensis]SDK31926.1 hypothetical protein SAMN04487954_114119 [Halomonas gudaonensis]
MTTRKRNTQAAKAKAEETQAAEPDTQPGQGAKEPEEKDTAKQPAAKDGATDTSAESQAKAAEKGEKINTPPQGGKGDGKKGEIPALYVRTKRRFKSRRRAGFRFDRTGFGIALAGLSDDQVAALKGDPALEVTECTVPAQPDSEAEA